jgi:hypothetical protein
MNEKPIEIKHTRGEWQVLIRQERMRKRGAEIRTFTRDEYEQWRYKDSRLTWAIIACELIIGAGGIGFILGFHPLAYSSVYGVVGAISVNNPSSISFTNGQVWYGDINKIQNLSVGNTCILDYKNNRFATQDSFIGGACVT